MGWACAAAGLPGMTVSLQVRYHRPVPLETPLRVYAQVTGTEGRRSSWTARSAPRRTRRSSWSPQMASSSHPTPTAPAPCSRTCVECRPCHTPLVSSAQVVGDELRRRVRPWPPGRARGPPEESTCRPRGVRRCPGPGRTGRQPWRARRPVPSVQCRRCGAGDDGRLVARQPLSISRRHRSTSSPTLIRASNPSRTASVRATMQAIGAQETGCIALRGVRDPWHASSKPC